MPDTERFAIVRQLLEEAVERTPLPASSQPFLRIPLQQPGKLLGGAEQPLWPATVLAVCAASGADQRLGSKVAAAVELFMASLDILDELEDGDRSPLAETVGPARALNISTMLLFLAQSLLQSLHEDGLPAERVLQLTKTLTTFGIEATVGQDRDLQSANAEALSYDEALTIAQMKAGALVACACTISALLATDDPYLLKLYGDWGRHYGTAAQLANDLHDATNANKSDLAQQKGTLPLLYERTTNDGAVSPPAVATSGALHFTWVVLEMERQQCAELATMLTAHGQAARHLQTLPGAVE